MSVIVYLYMMVLGCWFCCCGCDNDDDDDINPTGETSELEGSLGGTGLAPAAVAAPVAITLV